MDKLKQIFFDGDLSVGTTLNAPKETSRRLSRVLRQKKGDSLSFFNGRDGLFEIEILDDKCTELYIKSILKPQKETPQITLMVAMVKKDAMDRIFRQATEFGVTDIIPLTSNYTVVDKLNEERIQALLIEAAEQCERLTIPKLHNITYLETAVKASSGCVYWCAEHIGGKWGSDATTTSKDALLIGPEGGFSPKERAWLNDCINVTPVGLGDYILRSDTAVCAALSRFFDHFQ